VAYFETQSGIDAYLPSTVKVDSLALLDLPDTSRGLLRDCWNRRRDEFESRHCIKHQAWDSKLYDGFPGKDALHHGALGSEPTHRRHPTVFVCCVSRLAWSGTFEPKRHEVVNGRPVLVSRRAFPGCHLGIFQERNGDDGVCLFPIPVFWNPCMHMLCASLVICSRC
jgi:hypothetical protein